MKLAWLTDIHLNFLRDPDGFIGFLAESDADAFLVGGDIGEADDVCLHLNGMDNALGRPVYFVLGNHDYYRGSIAGVREKVAALCEACPNLHYLSNEGVIPLDELYRGCEMAREMLVAPNDVSRVIARPFVGEPGAYTRTKNRRDLSIEPPSPTLLDALAEAGVSRAGVGKTDDLFAGRNLTARHTANNAEGIAAIAAWLREADGLLFANLVDFDTQFGHRNDVAGFYGALRELDRALVGLDVDHVPTGDEIARLGVRAVGGDRGGVRPPVAHPGLRWGERLRVDPLAALPQQLPDVLQEGHVRLHVLGGPLVHWEEGMVRLAKWLG